MVHIFVTHWWSNMSNYILQRGNSQYFRRRIPNEFANFFPQAHEVRIPFRKISKLSATIKARKLNILFEELIMALQLDTFDKKEAIVNEYMTLMKESLKESYYSNPNLVSKRGLQFEQLQCEHSIERGHSHIASSQIEDVLHHANIDTEQIDHNTYKQIEKLYLHKKADMLQEVIHMIEPKKDFHDKKELSPTPLANITFEKLYELFIEHIKEEAPDTAKTTWRDYQTAYNDFIYVTEDAKHRDISTFTRDDFKEFVKALHHHLPKSRTKKAQFKNLPYSKLKKIELKDDEKQAFETKKKKMSTIKQIFDIATDNTNGFLSENLAYYFLIRKAISKKGKIDRANQASTRNPLSEENLAKLFNSKHYTTKQNSILMFQPEKYWIPILALFTGMRQNEICQLKINDVKQKLTDEGNIIFYFDINEEEDKHLKNDNAFRLMPLHPKLIELGFIDYYNSVKDKQDRLWKNLRFHPTEERYNKDYNRSFMAYFRRYVTTDEKQVFHSFRHNVGDQLLDNAVKYKLPKSLMNQLMGHAPDKDETSNTYSKGYKIESLYEGIKTLELGNVV